MAANSRASPEFKIGEPANRRRGSDANTDLTVETPSSPQYSPPGSSFSWDDDFISSICSSNGSSFLHIVDYRPRILEVLSRIGYHRARVSSVSDYDKMIGGISWIMSRFEKAEKRPSNTKTFQDCFRETGTHPKSDNELKTECQHIIRGLFLMNCLIHFNSDDLINVDFYTVATILDWLIPKMIKLEGNEYFFKYYKFVLLSPLQEEDDDEDRVKPTLVTMFRRALYMPNKMRLSQAKHCDMFDYSIIFDKNVNPRQALAEYITYSRTGVRTYPLVFDKLLKEDLTEDETDPFDLTPNVYHILTELANGLFDNLQEPGKKALDVVLRTLRCHRFNSRLRVMHQRCVEEYHNLNTLQKSYEEQNAVYEKVHFQAYDKSPFNIAAQINSAVNHTKERAGHMVHMMISDYEDAYAEIERIQARGYCPFGREECDNLRENAERRLKNLNDMRRRSKFIGNALNRFNTAMDDFNGAPYKKMNNYIPMKEAMVDQILAGELGMWVEKINHTVRRRVPQYLDGPEPEVQEIRNAFVAYMTDCRICIADLQQKAELLRDRRIEMSKQLEIMHGKIFVEQLKALSYDRMLETLRKLNVQLYEFRDVVSAMEKDSPTFNNTPIGGAAPAPAPAAAPAQ